MYLRAFSPLLFDGNQNLLQVFVGAGVADHQFVFASDDTHGVRLGVPSLEALTGQVDGEGLGFAGIQLDLGVGTEGL